MKILYFIFLIFPTFSLSDTNSNTIDNKTPEEYIPVQVGENQQERFGNVQLQLAKGYSLRGGLDPTKKHFGGYGYILGQVKTPEYRDVKEENPEEGAKGYYDSNGFYIQEAPPPPQQTGNKFLSNLGGSIDLYQCGIYVVAMCVAAASIWYISCFYTNPAQLLLPELAAAEEKDDKKTEGPTTIQESDSKETKKIRRRRREIKDSEMSKIAEVVLTAIESGECLQKTICLIGSQVSDGDGKGRLASTLMDKLIPISIQNTMSYNTFKKSLRGEGHCERFKCYRKF